MPILARWSAKAPMFTVASFSTSQGKSSSCSKDESWLAMFSRNWLEWGRRR